MYNLSSLSSLLEKFRHLKNPREERERLVATLTECSGFEIPFETVDLKIDILYINVSGYMKTEIFMRKEMILTTLKEKGFKVGDIR
ncbi:MAG: hypothetical protein JWP09_25 [Candidatus Taylorbacteria bacterium]|nr:hypothetical protein [Candidatus Taylorbacteria bacterium]